MVSGAAEVTPLTVYGNDLAQWHEGSDVVLNGSSVSTFIDLSNYGLNSTQVVAAEQPAYTSVDATLDNQPTATFDGSNDVVISTLTTALTDDFYIGAIIKAISWADSDTLFGGNAGTTPPRSFQSGSTPRMVQYAAAAANPNTGAVLGTWVYYEGLWSTTPGASYLKIGASTVTGGNPGTGERVSSRIGSAPLVLFSNFALAEYFVVKRAAGSGGPTAPERAEVQAYLQTKYPSAVYS